MKVLFDNKTYEIYINKEHHIVLINEKEIIDITQLIYKNRGVKNEK